MKRRVAVKQILPRAIPEQQEAAYVARLGDVAALAHPNIVGIYDVLKSGEGLFVVMEALTEGTLHGRLRDLAKQGKWLSTGEATLVIRQLLSALAAMHGPNQRGVLHVDLKLSNIAIDESGAVKLIDLGVGILTEIGARPALSFSYQIPDAGYTAPEQNNRGVVDCRTDLFQVGILAHLLFTGVHPLVDEKGILLAREMVFNPNLKAADNQTAEIAEFLRRLLAVDPERRYASANVALGQLADLKK